LEVLWIWVSTGGALQSCPPNNISCSNSANKWNVCALVYFKWSNECHHFSHCEKEKSWRQWQCELSANSSCFHLFERELGPNSLFKLWKQLRIIIYKVVLRYLLRISMRQRRLTMLIPFRFPKNCATKIFHVMWSAFFYWFRQDFIVRRKDSFLSPFPVLNSVTQGGILSAYFFAVYIDELSIKLTNCGVGCRVGTTVINNVFYTDDICLLTSATQHDLIFNPKKSACQCFGDSSYSNVRPLIRFRGQILRWNDTVRYLGFDINCNDLDYEEIDRRQREIYARANLIVSRFSSCSYEVKLYLFRTYFSNIYCSSLWVPVRRNILYKLRRRRQLILQRRFHNDI